MRKNESTIKNSLRREPNSYTMPTNPSNVLWWATFMVVRISKPAPDNWLWVDDLGGKKDFSDPLEESMVEDGL